MDTNPNIQIRKGGSILDYKYFIFSGGEISVKLDTKNLKYLYDTLIPYTIVARIQNSNDALTLAFLKDAIERWHWNAFAIKPTINLFMPYLPYARQDRVCDKGESLSLKVFANYINYLNFNKVKVVDPHNVSATEIAFDNNFEIISQFDVINRWASIYELGKTVFVSPDAGATKKTAEIAKYFSHDTFIRSDKLRDLTNGNIKETIVYCDNLKGQAVTIVDDLADGAATFAFLAKELKKKNAGNINLYVTHGIFSKGFEFLFESGISEIWTTDSFRTDIVDLSGKNRIHVLKLEDIIKF